LSRTGNDRSDADAGPGLSAGQRAKLIRVVAAMAVGVILLDQLTKTLAVDRLSRGPIHLVGSFWLALSYNTGVAFSLATGLTLPIIIVAAVLVAVVAWFGRTVPNVAAAVGIGMILGGALGNLGDRLLRGHHGAVVDFVHSGFWPTFNVADSSIVCGSIVLGIALWRASAPPSTTDEETGAAP